MDRRTFIVITINIFCMIGFLIISFLPLPKTLRIIVTFIILIVFVVNSVLKIIYDYKMRKQQREPEE